MKKQILYSATIILLVALSLTGCKKDNKTTKDYSPSFKNKTWTGEFWGTREIDNTQPLVNTGASGPYNEEYSAGPGY